MLIKKKGPQQMTERIELPNQEKIRTLREKETYKYLGIIKYAMKEFKKKKGFLRGKRKPLKTNLHRRNLIKGLNTWPVALVRYSEPFSKWTREELQIIDQRTRKLMKMHKTLHPRDDVDRLYLSRKEGGRGLTSIQDSVNELIPRIDRKIIE